MRVKHVLQPGAKSRVFYRGSAAESAAAASQAAQSVGCGCQPPPTMPPPRAALSGPSPLSREEHEQSTSKKCK